MARRHRITITINDELLGQLDRLTDGRKIRNRSHAVEYLLQRSLGHETRQAVILASGAGVAMRPFTYEIPKPLIPVHGRPLLEYTIDLLRRHDIRDIIVTVSHLQEQIMERFGDGSRMGVRIRYIQETEPTGTGGALRAAASMLSSFPALVMYGDVLIDLDVTEFLKAHEENGRATATIALTSAADPSEFGSVRLRGTRVADFAEKPHPSSSASHLVFAGALACNKDLLSRLPKRSAFSLERDVFPELVADQRLYGFPFEGQWFDVSTPDIYERTLKEWEKT